MPRWPGTFVLSTLLFLVPISLFAQSTRHATLTALGGVPIASGASGIAASFHGEIGIYDPEKAAENDFITAHAELLYVNPYNAADDINYTLQGISAGAFFDMFSDLFPSRLILGVATEGGLLGLNAKPDNSALEEVNKSYFNWFFGPQLRLPIRTRSMLLMEAGLTGMDGRSAIRGRVRFNLASSEHISLVVEGRAQGAYGKDADNTELPTLPNSDQDQPLLAGDGGDGWLLVTAGVCYRF